MTKSQLAKKLIDRNYAKKEFPMKNPLTKTAAKELRKIQQGNPVIFKKIVESIKDLAENPFPNGYIKNSRGKMMLIVFESGIIEFYTQLKMQNFSSQCFVLVLVETYTSTSHNKFCSPQITMGSKRPFILLHVQEAHVLGLAGDK